MNHSSFVKSLKQFAPDIYQFYHSVLAFYADQEPEEKLAELYGRIHEISIDYAVMEKTDSIITAEASFDWDDVGSWTSMRNQIQPGDIITRSRSHADGTQDASSSESNS